MTKPRRADRRKATGDAGEAFVARHLSNSGWQVLDRQWRGPSGELDIVALDGDILVFVEVKTRRGNRFGDAEDAIDPAKAARLLDLGEQYIQAHPEHGDRLWRVDLVAVTIAQGEQRGRVTHITNACEDG